MCSNYKPPSRESIEEYFGLPMADEFKLEMYPGYLGPMLRLDVESNHMECVLGTFGLIPHWGKSTLARSTYNCRSETASTKPSFRNAWKRRQHCVLPASWIYEPHYGQTGKSVRWKIFRKDSRPFGIAGLWEWRPDPQNPAGALSYSMLTVNADSHELMKRFHAPDDEKRMVVILDPSEYTSWLKADPSESMAFMRQYPADLLAAAPAPKPPRGGEERVAA